MTTTQRQEPSTTYKVIRDICAGTLAGINVTLIGHPFDTLKVRLQTQSVENPLYKGLVDCFRKTLEWEGVGGLYKGVMSPLAGQIFFRVLLFTSHGQAKRTLSENGKRQLTVPEMFMAGGAAWAVGALAECPIDLFKSQMQVQIIKEKTVKDYKPPFKNMLDCVRFILRTNGVRGAYQGFLPHLCRNIPAGAVHLGLFEAIRSYVARRDNIPMAKLPLSVNLFAGGVGGFFYWFLFFPIDVVKSSIQSDNVVKSQRKYHGIVDTVGKLYREGGIRRFYRGFSPCLMRSVPANAIMLLTVAWVVDHF
jgi:solute carrier family 25 carnitine/acylcarnitine transporter 20/29